MQKKLLATAITATLWASTAEAARVYDQDGSSLDIYGRISIGVAGGGADFNSSGNKVSKSAEFVDVYSRLGFRMSHQLTPDLKALGHLEWRFAGDENTEQGFTELRKSYIGLQSHQYGTVLAGSFDSVYAQFVSLPFDVYQDRGLLFKSSGIQSRGDSLAYYTPELNGFTSFVQLKHYSERGLTIDEQSREGSVVAAQGGVRYQQGPLTVGFGAVEDIVRGGGNGEMLYGLIGAYKFSDLFTARLGYETQDESSEYGGGFDTVGLGGSIAMGPWAFTADYYNVERESRDNSNAWAAGAYYKVSSSFDVLLELADGDAPRINRETQLGELSDNVYWLVGARYLF
ncbi:putative porin [Vreelandella songnenensis]|uniref:Putative porin n=1 Tax=Vreelandella songnenensis TaxID=1176243 RepID=A0A2T0V854_9GAMM|nr:porin [Halomonas songnenensis]PRY66356.1 putative porin [Halomonas songnenensis]